MYSGIPGTSSLIPSEGILMFQEERDEIEAQTKIVDIFRDIHDIFNGTLNKMEPQRGANESVQTKRMNQSHIRKLNNTMQEDIMN